MHDAGRERSLRGVYLGRLLWCILEGVSTPQREIWMEYLRDPDIEFPTFRHTPRGMQELILNCTQAHQPERKTLSRKGHTLVLNDHAGSTLTVGDDGLAGQIVEYWGAELEAAKTFLAARYEERSTSVDIGNAFERLNIGDVLEALRRMQI